MNAKLFMWITLKPPFINFNKILGKKFNYCFSSWMSGKARGKRAVAFDYKSGSNYHGGIDHNQTLNSLN